MLGSRRLEAAEERMREERTTREPLSSQASADAGTDDPKRRLDVATILDNLVELDQLLDETSRRKLSGLPYLEFSKHVRIRRAS